jgi:hypothetical protein
LKILYTFFTKIGNLIEEVNCTEPSPKVSIPWHFMVVFYNKMFCSRCPRKETFIMLASMFFVFLNAQLRGASIDIYVRASQRFLNGPMLSNLLRLQFINVCDKPVSVPGKPLQPSLMFAGKAGYPQT